MKYNDNGTYKDIYVKAFDTLPVGTEVDYDGNTVPDGWEEVYSDNILVANLTTNNITLSEGSGYSLVTIPLNNQNLKIGNKLTFDSTNNCIIIGAGVNHVKISGQAYTGTFSVTSGIRERILVGSINNTWTMQSGIYKTMATNERMEFNISSAIVSVSQGDAISLKMSSEAVETMKIYGGTDLKTFLSVEVID